MNHAPTSTVMLYQKPAYLCKSPKEVFPEIDFEAEDFFTELKAYVVQALSSHNLSIRPATVKDIPAVEEFTRNIYKGEQATEISPYDLYRFLKFGHGVLLHDKDGILHGCLFGVRYQTSEKPSYTIRLAVDPDWSGKEIGYHLILFSCLHAKENGALVKSGIIDFDNHVNQYINLNRIGWICRDFDGYIDAVGSCFEVCLPLTVDGFTQNVIDKEKVRQFVANARPNIDYKLIHYQALDEMHSMFRDSNFKVVAFMAKGTLKEDHYYLAIPATELNYQPIEA